MSWLYSIWFDVFGRFWLHLQLAYYETALEQVDPLSDDVPYIVGRLSEIHDQLNKE